MEQYIPKSVVLAEIERRIADVNDECNKSKRLRFTLYGKTSALINLHSFLNILEVKEIGVDLGDPKGDKSAKHIIDTKALEVKEVDLDKVFNDEYLKFSNDTDAGDYAFPIDLADFKYFAKHFFELGLKAQKGD